MTHAEDSLIMSSNDVPLDSVVYEVLNDEDSQTQRTYHDVMLELIDEVSLGICFETHRAAKVGTLFLSDTDNESKKEFRIIDEVGRDVFGQVPMKKQMECVCPNCSRNMAASRFAPHLEKCMGMGRNSSRIASRRIARSGKQESDNDSDYEPNLDEWTLDRKVKKKARDKVMKSKKFKANRNGDNSNIETDVPNYEVMTLEERKAYLLHSCGVISEHTKKMCTRSHKCPQHSEDQRKAVRGALLQQSSSLIDVNDEDHVDIDTYEEGDTQALHESLQWEAISNPSPADSTSTNNSSTGSKKRHKKQASISSKKQKTLSKSASSTPPNNLYEFM